MFIDYRGKAPRVAASAFVAPTAILVGDVVVGEDSCIWFGVVLRADTGKIRIGARSSIEDNAVVHASAAGTTIVGSDVTVGHCAVLDDCTIRDGAQIGSNAVVLNGAHVGEQSLVAAGAVVVANAQIPPRVVVAGAPAVVKKTLEGASLGWVEHPGPEYVALSRSYLRHGIGDPAMHEIADTHVAP